MKDLQADLDQRRADGLYRRRRIIDSAQGVETRIDGKMVLSFCSNDYLGLANHPDISQAFVDAVGHYGVGSGAAHLINGHSRAHEQLEQRLAEFTGRERALLFSTGYMANIAIASALLGRNDLVYQDRLNHASLLDSARLCDARLVRYRHNDVAQLEALLSDGRRDRRRLIMTDGVFSMDGDCADLESLGRIAAEHGAWAMVDDAHGFGVLGTRGAGLLEQLELAQQQVPILMATLGKAVGTAGAFVAGSEALIETLIQQARPYIYTTASPPALAAATLKAIDIVETESWRREKLFESVAYFRAQAQALGLDLMASETAIQPIVIGDNQEALSLSNALYERGIHVTAIRPPTVPVGSARLRVTLSAAHERAHIDRLIEALKSVGWSA
ncbi:MAG: 8-amino-7-oxononanoate synthase [Gammaproteobacteria bacterium]|nr:8-amino-7-oxononanoate synthase [Gammaproteobacteria bacterium]MDH3446881.1 8-amino-7-oxononanoate synthase [Gammaproteobacteria bacterium]